ncbi:hypothetical protein SCLCIDRAFT_1220557 [Scleroderma citrinum Foug A]|uniref:Uncharacterized protein n=1 Tax=Scleroderma citrinum Foug A TaxID=1036808 RepID=A0A0C3DIL3_9AGAM|nr:hypothetical protein SCLCIDRAFT_1220557 [Scleroderma citrinum Foug A]
MVELHSLLVCSDIVEPHGLVPARVRGNMCACVSFLPRNAVPRQDVLCPILNEMVWMRS